MDNFLRDERDESNRAGRALARIDVSAGASSMHSSLPSDRFAAASDTSLITTHLLWPHDVSKSVNSMRRITFALSAGDETEGLSGAVARWHAG